MIAMAFACKPDILSADEPTTALEQVPKGQLFRCFMGCGKCRMIQ